MGRIGRYLGMVAFAGMVGGVFWVDYRGTEMGSRSALFGGRDLEEPVAGAVAFTVTEPERSVVTLQVVDAAGGEARLLADDVGLHSPPSWSPDQARVAYATRSERLLRTVGGGGDTAVLTAATADAPQDREPAWSPDGTHLAFLSDARDGVPITSIFVVPAAGGQPRRIGPELQQHQECLPALNDTARCGPAPTGDADKVAWLSADELVYAATVEQDQDPAAPGVYEAVHALYRVALDGTPPQLITEFERLVDQLVPSPDGRFLLFGQANSTTHVLELASGERWQIGRDVDDPRWSPDGEHLLFGASTQVYTSAPDGSGRVNLTHSHFADSFDDVLPQSAAWSPDGRHIAFLAHSGGGERVYLANADGTGWTERFRTEGDVAELHWLSWQP